MDLHPSMGGKSLLFNNIVVSTTAFLIVFATTPLVRKYALRWKLGDKPNGRKVHTCLIPHLGGIGMVLGVIGALVVYRFFLMPEPPKELFFLWRILPGVVLIVLLGLVDDMMSLKVFQKLVVQILAALLVVAAGFNLLVGIPFIDQIALVPLLFTVVYLVAISSAVNLIDGHDGLAGGICFISASAFACISSMLGATSLLAISIALGASCLAFLAYNFPPGKIFMGDTGSMFLGLVLGLIACSLSLLRPGITTFFGVCFVIGVPIMDALLAIARRMSFRMPVFNADALHMHHVLGSFGLSPKQTLFILYSVQTVLAVLGFFAVKGFVFPVIIGCAFFVVMCLLFFRLMIAAGRQEREEADALTRDSIPALENEAIASKSSH
ncbi:MAG: MraY family glycosyltransferase [Candidatus Latescibacterota bacterium]